MRVPGFVPEARAPGRAAVVKARYTRAKTSTSARKISSSARVYALSRRREGAAERETFSKDQGGMSREGITTYLNRADARHAYHYRCVISPGTDRNAEGVNLSDYTQRVLGELEQRRGPMSWVAVAHVGEGAHTEHAHIHLVMSVDTRFSLEELGTFRTLAERIWKTVRRGGEETP